MKCRTPEAAEGPPGVLLVFKTPISAKKYKNMRFCYVKSLYFRYISKIKKFRTKNPGSGSFLYGIHCFEALYTKLTLQLQQGKSASCLEIIKTVGMPINTGFPMFSTNFQISR